MSKISIIVPVYFNEDTIMLLYQDMKERILSQLGDYEIIFVDDGSEDHSWDIMNQIKNMDEHVVCVRLSRNFGEHAAILAGFSVCSGDCAVTKQADLQEDSEIILQMFESWKKGNKVVLAVRSSRSEGFVKKFFAHLYYSIIHKIVNERMPEGGCDCYLIDRQVIQILELLDEKNSSLTLQVLWAGFKTDKIYFHRKDREIGKSRWTLAKKIKLFQDSIMSFSVFPIQFVTRLGIVIFFLSIIMTIEVFIEKIFFDVPIVGWASMMAVLLGAVGLNFLVLGILGEYIFRALDASQNRPPFIIDEIQRNQPNS